MIELFPYAITNSEYLDKSGILIEQKKFKEVDGIMKFIKFVDRGHRIIQASWKNGQFMSQPIYSKSN